MFLGWIESIYPENIRKPQKLQKHQKYLEEMAIFAHEMAILWNWRLKGEYNTRTVFQ